MPTRITTVLPVAKLYSAVPPPPGDPSVTYTDEPTIVGGSTSLETNDGDTTYVQTEGTGMVSHSTIPGSENVEINSSFLIVFPAQTDWDVLTPAPDDPGAVTVDFVLEVWVRGVSGPNTGIARTVWFADPGDVYSGYDPIQLLGLFDEGATAPVGGTYVLRSTTTGMSWAQAQQWATQDIVVDAMHDANELAELEAGTVRWTMAALTMTVTWGAGIQGVAKVNTGSEWWWIGCETHHPTGFGRAKISDGTSFWMERVASDGPIPGHPMKVNTGTSWMKIGCVIPA